MRFAVFPHFRQFTQRLRREHFLSRIIHRGDAEVAEKTMRGTKLSQILSLENKLQVAQRTFTNSGVFSASSAALR
jgi:hypothetical protein